MKLNEIKNPEFLRNMSYKELETLAQDLRVAILETLSRKGGHLSSNLGVVELTIALHRSFNQNDKILFDVGHQSYTHKILTGRYNDFISSLRDYNGISGYQKRHESHFDCFEAGHSSTSISAAIGFSVANRINNVQANVVAVIGDGALTSGIALEALNNLGGMKEKVIVVLNDNEMAISRAVGGITQAFSRIKTSLMYERTRSIVRATLYFIPLGKYIYKFFRHLKNGIKRFFISTTLFENLNLKYIGPIDGHNIKKIEKSLAYAIRYPSSIVLHIVTKKGKGYEHAENDHIGLWHGVPKFEIDTGFHESNGDRSWSEATANIVYNCMKNDPTIVTITPAMIEGSKLHAIADDFANRFFDVGICEEHAFTFAAGLALNNIKPYICIYSTFMQRSYDQISHDLSRMNLGAVIGVDRSGFVGKDGETHQGTFDVAFVRTIPNTIIAMPRDYNDAIQLYSLAFSSNRLFFIRFPRESVDISQKLSSLAPLEIGQWDYLARPDDNQSVIIVTGPNYEKVKQYLCDNNNVDLVFARFYQPFDETILNKITLNKKKVFIYDIYSDYNGLVIPLTALLLKMNPALDITSYALPNAFIKQGSIDEQLKEVGMDLETVLSDIIRQI